MTAETVLTDEEIITIGQQARAIESGGNGYILPVTFARAIEQAVLQSDEAQRLREDSARWRHFMFLLDNMGDDDDPNAPGFPHRLHEAFQEGSAKTIDVIDAAMEKQK